MDELILRHNRHATYSLQYHLVVCTKYRHPVIKDNLKKRIIEITYMVFEEYWNCTINTLNTGLDHIHILFEAPPQVQLSKLINNYKTVSARLIRKEFSEELKSYYWKPYFWSMAYFICTVSDRSASAVKEYIENQGKEE